MLFYGAGQQYFVIHLKIPSCAGVKAFICVVIVPLKYIQSGRSKITGKVFFKGNRGGYFF
jgi:hypothetical protein